LKPLSQAHKKTNGTKGTATHSQFDDDTAELRNQFEYLEVEDPTEWNSSALPSKSKSSKTVGTYELEPRDEDISFAIFCLLKDLTDIRHYVRQTVSKIFDSHFSWTFWNLYPLIQSYSR
jgi:hypothetical protein